MKAELGVVLINQYGLSIAICGKRLQEGVHRSVKYINAWMRRCNECKALTIVGRSQTSYIISQVLFMMVTEHTMSLSTNIELFYTSLIKHY